jgi:hypothetical protein
VGDCPLLAVDVHGEATWEARTVGHEAEDDDGEERLDASRAEDDFAKVDHCCVFLFLFLFVHVFVFVVVVVTLRLRWYGMQRLCVPANSSSSVIRKERTRTQSTSPQSINLLAKECREMYRINEPEYQR